MRKRPKRPTIQQDRIAAKEKLTGSSNNSNLLAPPLSYTVISTSNSRVILDVGHGSLNYSPTFSTLKSLRKLGTILFIILL